MPNHATKLRAAPDSETYDPRQRLIVALDVSTASAAHKIVTELGESVLTYKVGMQLFTAEGPPIVRQLIAGGKQVFLDLKYHDIPNTVAKAVAEAAGLGVHMLTVHASGGRTMLQGAVEAARGANPSAMVLGVTVLTSTAQSDLGGLGVPGSLVDHVLRLASLAIESGCQGIVASAQEAAALRSELGEEFAIVTPGVRLAGGDIGDQARVVTPAQAIGAGATHIVVGRPVTGAADPAAAVRAILGEMGE